MLHIHLVEQTIDKKMATMNTKNKCLRHLDASGTHCCAMLDCYKNWSFCSKPQILWK